MGIVANQSIKGTIATYLGVAIGFFINFFVIIKYLSAEQVGFLNNVLLNTAIFFSQFSLMGIPNSTIRFFPYIANKHNGHNGLFFWIAIISLIGFILFALLFLLFKNTVINAFIDKSPLFAYHYLAILPLSFFLIYLTLFETYANVLMRVAVTRFVRDVGTRIGMLFFYFLYIKNIISFDGLINAQCLIYALAALINFLYLLHLKQISFKPHLSFYKQNINIVKSFVRYSSFTYIVTVATGLVTTMVNLFLSAQKGEHTTGVYTIALFIASLVGVPTRTIHPILAPQLSQSIKDNDWTKTSHIFSQGANTIFVISSFIFLCLWINVDSIYHTLPNGQVYQTGKNALFILCLWDMMQAVFANILTVLNYSKYYKYSLLLTLGHAVFSVFLTNLMIDKMGMNGAAISSFASYCIFYLLTGLLIYHFTHFNPFRYSMIKTGVLFVLVLCANVFLQSLFANMHVYASSIIRSTLLLTAFAFIVYKFRLSQEINKIIEEQSAKIFKRP